MDSDQASNTGPPLELLQLSSDDASPKAASPNTHGQPLRLATGVGRILSGAPSSSGPRTAFDIFSLRRRLEIAAKGGSATKSALFAEWQKLSEGEKAEFEIAAKARRDASRVEGAGDFLRRQQEEQKKRPAVRPINPNDGPSNKKLRKSKDPVQKEVPLPALPSFPSKASPTHERQEKRRELTKALRSQAENRGSQVVTMSSHGADLEHISSRLSAPSFSFDWQQPLSDDEGGLPAEKDGEAAAETSTLTVDLPIEASSNSSSSSSVRGLLRKELSKRVSSAQVKCLLMPPSLPAMADAGA
eukprot:TRINITY_DN5649_c1_g4_i1.p1 TRINITY_DN5649_c1_g4~~TRINITY_DN5649_c1_g4_i1.p1  ORF type:complete len:301 (+),score=75.67 TRINITY_DN5649_c1_g4_i1:145-1047(+)